MKPIVSPAAFDCRCRPLRRPPARRPSRGSTGKSAPGLECTRNYVNPPPAPVPAATVAAAIPGIRPHRRRFGETPGDSAWVADVPVPSLCSRPCSDPFRHGDSCSHPDLRSALKSVPEERVLNTSDIRRLGTRTTSEFAEPVAGPAQLPALRRQQDGWHLYRPGVSLCTANESVGSSLPQCQRRAVTPPRSTCTEETDHPMVDTRV